MGYLGEEFKKLGFGFMRLPMNGEEIDMKQTKEMVDIYMEKGFTYFDTAYVYHNEKSENALREALVDRYPRESFQLATKMPLWMCETSEDLDRIFHESLERAGTEYYDFYLLHAMDKARFEKADAIGAWDYVKKMKAEGKIKHTGFSFHDTADVLDAVLAKHRDEVEFIQLQINFVDWNDKRVQAKQCYEVALKYDMPIIIMEPVRGGALVNLPEEAKEIFKAENPNVSIPSWAIRYCASLKNIVTVLSGMSNLEQLNDNVSYMENFQPLNEKEQEAIAKVVDIFNALPKVPCTACRYCIEDCPKKINIASIFQTTNNHKMFGNGKITEEFIEEYNNLVKDGGKASDCIRCGKCQGHCPQHISIIEELAKIAKDYEA